MSYVVAPPVLIFGPGTPLSLLPLSFKAGVMRISGQEQVRIGVVSRIPRVYVSRIETARCRRRRGLRRNVRRRCRRMDLGRCDLVGAAICRCFAAKEVIVLLLRGGLARLCDIVGRAAVPGVELLAIEGVGVHGTKRAFGPSSANRISRGQPAASRSSATRSTASTRMPSRSPPPASRGVSSRPQTRSQAWTRSGWSPSRRR